MAMEEGRRHNDSVELPVGSIEVDVNSDNILDDINGKRSVTWSTENVVYKTTHRQSEELSNAPSTDEIAPPKGGVEDPDERRRRLLVQARMRCRKHFRDTDEWDSIDPRGMFRIGYQPINAKQLSDDEDDDETKPDEASKAPTHEIQPYQKDEEEFWLLAVTIRGYEKIDGAVYYKIDILTDRFRWVVMRRYSEFHDLHAKMNSMFHLSRKFTNFPPKKMFGNTSNKFVVERQRKLEEFLTTLICDPDAVVSMPLVRFLQLDSAAKACSIGSIALLKAHMAAAWSPPTKGSLMGNLDAVDEAGYAPIHYCAMRRFCVSRTMAELLIGAVDPEDVVPVTPTRSAIGGVRLGSPDGSVREEAGEGGEGSHSKTNRSRPLSVQSSGSRSSLKSPKSGGGEGHLEFGTMSRLAQTTSDGMTPLHLAAKKDNVSMVQFLCDNGVDLNATEPANLQTPLHLAMIAMGDASAEVLIVAGADQSKKDRFGKVPSEYSISHQQVSFGKGDHPATGSFKPSSLSLAPDLSKSLENAAGGAKKGAVDGEA